jgi:starvation-inducible outer membrane lipoprotein
MKITTAMLTASVALLLSACASTPSAHSADADEVICRREVPTGSIKAVTRCRTVSQIWKDEADAGKTLDVVRQAPSDAASGR